MTSFWHKLIALFVALILLLAAAVADTSAGGGGDNGIINLPGGRRQGSGSQQGGGSLTGCRLTAQVVGLDRGFTLNLPEDMPTAVVVAQLPDTFGQVFFAVTDGELYVDGPTLREIFDAKVAQFWIRILSPNGLGLDVLVTFKEDGSGLTLRVY
ncbi:MAG: hypothetical protein IT458_19510 [Planctomycetes bacterium]|nr:hypothetical protein [Planctomycetota bacterium]